MKTYAIAAISKNNVLGKDNKLLWKLSDDMKLFKQYTTNNVVIMGRKTFDSMGKALPNRINIVVSRNAHLYYENIVHAPTLFDAIEKAKEYGTDVFIIGGGEIYKQSLSLVDELIISHVNCTIDGDTFFPEIDEHKWQKVGTTSHTKNEKNEFDFDVIRYIRK